MSFEPNAPPPPAAATVAGAETDWMRRIAAGEGLAMSQMMERWKLPLLGFLQRLVGSRADAEELVLEVFVRLHRAAPRYEPTARFSTFLFSIAQRLALNELRRRRRKPVELVAPETFDHLAGDASEERRLADLEESFQIALGRLAPKHRTALLLVVQQGLGYEEAAQVLNSTPNAVRVLVHRARQELKAKMEELT